MLRADTRVNQQSPRQNHGGVVMTAECGFIKEPCPFCKEEETLRFNEHYNFCPNCTAIYTDMMVERSCEHFDKDALVVTREPGLRGLKYDVTFIDANSQRCNKCKTLCNLGGW